MFPNHYFTSEEQFILKNRIHFSIVKVWIFNVEMNSRKTAKFFMAFSINEIRNISVKYVYHSAAHSTHAFITHSCTSVVNENLKLLQWHAFCTAILCWNYNSHAVRYLIKKLTAINIYQIICQIHRVFVWYLLKIRCDFK